MRDPRYDALAELVLDHSLRLQPGDVLRIEGDASAAAPLVVPLHREAIKRGAHAYAALELGSLKEILVAQGSDEQLDFVSPMELREIDAIDASITIWSESNTRSFTRADTNRRQRQLTAQRQVAIRRRDRIASGEHRWCGTLCPTEAHAQDADMSLEDYEDFVFRACHVLDDDPLDHWRQVGERLQARADELGSVRELRIVGEDTDLTVVVGGRTWRPAYGRQNVPDGEVYTSPVETGVNGTIRFGFPAVFSGREIDDARLTLENGRVVEAEAAGGEEYLRSLLELDDGASGVGEIAFGLNYEIDRFTRNILFDEKIGGTMHMALGMGFEALGGQNRSALHLDLICDLRREGEVYADGELIWRNGQFLQDPQPAQLAEHVR
ncbi:MAG: aminopeptidase [Actinobacteria bacterium]|nr:MAG: aminopeptidase [Actinomycetota bacterium]